MFERPKTSAERLDERLHPWRWSRGNRTVQKMTRTTESFKAAPAEVVHDVQGPIVTGVLGGD